MKLLRFKMLSLSACALCALVALPASAQDRRVSPEQLQGYWILLNHTVDIDLPIGGKNLSDPGCVAVTYTIGSDGKTRNIQVAKVVPESGLGKAAISAVKNFQYGPSLTNRQEQPVATYYIVPFNTPPGKDAQTRLMAPCKLSGYDQG